MENPTHARLHRFGKHVALEIGLGETVYLSPEMAEELSMELRLYATDVRTTSFVDSQIGTQTITDS